MSSRPAASGRGGRANAVRGIVLPVVLLIIGLLALVMAGFVFFVRSEMAGIQAYNGGQQARLAAESGLEFVTSILRTSRDDSRAWFDVPDHFRHALVFSPRFDRQSDPVKQSGSRKTYLQDHASAPEAWRFSIVGERIDGPEGAIRFGVTPETSKLNLNTASDGQLEQLLTPLLFEMGVQNGPELIAALLDWRDTDDGTREGGAENEYYNSLSPPYNAKDGRFDTVEELLAVRGFTAAVLYGEDVNRNGVLDPNENDGEESAPLYDNGDGALNRGLAPFLTVYSREPDTAHDNKPRIPLSADSAAVGALIAKNITEGELSPESIAFITGLKSQNVRLTSPADLYTAGDEPPGESGTGDEDDGAPGGPQGSADKLGGRSQTVDDEQVDDPNGENPRGSAGGRGGRGLRGGQDGPGVQPLDPQDAGRGGRRGGRGGAGGGGADGGAGRGGRGGGGVVTNSPITLAEMPIIMDRFTTRQVQPGQLIEGLININTAPARVLALIPGITPDGVGALLAAREKADALTLGTSAWPLTTGALDAATFKQIAPYITAKSYQFHVEVVGYADHVKLSRRLEWIIEMVGPLAQIKYHRDLTPLGFAWPVDSETIVSTGR